MARRLSPFSPQPRRPALTFHPSPPHRTGANDHRDRSEGLAGGVRDTPPAGGDRGPDGSGKSGSASNTRGARKAANPRQPRRPLRQRQSAARAEARGNRRSSMAGSRTPCRTANTARVAGGGPLLFSTHGGSPPAARRLFPERRPTGSPHEKARPPRWRGPLSRVRCLDAYSGSCPGTSPPDGVDASTEGVRPFTSGTDEALPVASPRPNAAG
ncbi:hypothetical protein SAMN05216566_103323 [Aureimonas phyllosphaerae]|nr:hypothetical protein SAMN05216566_103323 [Aureimonas phyllosphaerae]